MLRLARYRGWALALLVALAVLAICIGSRVASHVLSNIGMVSLSHVLGDRGRAATVEALVGPEDWLRRGLARDGDNASAHRGLARILAERGEYSQAASEWRMAGVGARYLQLWGEEAFRDGQYELALHWYEQAELVEPAQASDALYLQYWALRESGQEELAWGRLQEAVTVDQGWAGASTRYLAWQRWGVHLCDLGEAVRAEQALQMAIAASVGAEQDERGLALTYRMLGQAQLAQGKAQAATVSLGNSVRLDADSAWSRVWLGEAIYRSDVWRGDEVERVFSEGLRLGRDNVTIWKHVIEFWRAVGEPERASSVCQEGDRAGLALELQTSCRVP